MIKKLLALLIVILITSSAYGDGFIEQATGWLYKPYGLYYKVGTGKYDRAVIRYFDNLNECRRYVPAYQAYANKVYRNTTVMCMETLAGEYWKKKKGRNVHNNTARKGTPMGK